MKRIKSALLLALIIFSAFAGNIYLSDTTSALRTDYASKLKRYKLYYAIAECFRSSTGVEFIKNDSDLESGNWFGGDKKVGSFASGEDSGEISCQEVVKKTQEQFEYASVRDMGFAFKITSASGGSWRLERSSMLAELERASPTSYEDRFWYPDAFSSWSKQCEASRVPDGTGGADLIDIYYVGSDGAIEKQTWRYSTTKNANHGTAPYDGGRDEVSECKTLANILATESRAEAFANNSDLKPCDEVYAIQSHIDACEDGAANPDIADYCDKYAPGNGGNVGSLEEQQACQYGQRHGNSEPPGDDEDGEEGGEESPTCAIGDGLGWIICPFMNLMVTLNDLAFDMLKNFLEIPPQMASDQVTQDVWKRFRDIANVAFVIAFMVMIYSYLTSAGLSNYNIKKMLPRLIIAAVAINMSLLLSQIAVDLSNIIGHQMYSVVSNACASACEDTAVSEGQAFKAIIGPILIGAMSIPLLLALITTPAVLLAAALAVMILIARQAIIVLLIIVAPVAIALWLLPNTESWFKKWWKLFFALLMTFPIVGALFGGSTLAAKVLVSIADSSGGGDSQGLFMVAALGALGLPLLGLPSIISASLKGAGQLGSRLEQAQNKANKSASGSAKGRYDNSVIGQWNKFRGEEKKRRRAMIQSGVYSGDGIMDRLGGRNRRSAAMAKLLRGKKSPISGSKFATDMSAQGTYLDNKDWDEKVGRQKQLVSTHKNLSNDAMMSKMENEAGTLSTEEYAAMAGIVAATGDIKMQQRLVQHLHDAGAAAKGNASKEARIKGVQKQAKIDMKGKPFGVGDGTMELLGTGKLGVDNASKDPRQEFKERTISKLAPGKDLNVDDAIVVADAYYTDEANGGYNEKQRKKVEEMADRLAAEPLLAKEYGADVQEFFDGVHKGTGVNPLAGKNPGPKTWRATNNTANSQGGRGRSSPPGGSTGAASGVGAQSSTTSGSTSGGSAVSGPPARGWREQQAAAAEPSTPQGATVPSGSSASSTQASAQSASSPSGTLKPTSNPPIFTPGSNVPPAGPRPTDTTTPNSDGELDIPHNNDTPPTQP